MENDLVIIIMAFAIICEAATAIIFYKLGKLNSGRMKEEVEQSDKKNTTLEFMNMLKTGLVIGTILGGIILSILVILYWIMINSSVADELWTYFYNMCLYSAILISAFIIVGVIPYFYYRKKNELQTTN